MPSTKPPLGMLVRGARTGRPAFTPVSPDTVTANRRVSWDLSEGDHHLKVLRGMEPPIPLCPKWWRGQNFALISYVQTQTRSNMNNGVYTVSSLTGSLLVTWGEVGTMLHNIYLFDILIYSFYIEDTVIFKKFMFPEAAKYIFQSCWPFGFVESQSDVSPDNHITYLNAAFHPFPGVGRLRVTRNEYR